MRVRVGCEWACDTLFVLYAHVCVKEREIYIYICIERRWWERKGRERGTQSAKGWKARNPVTMRPVGGWGLLDLFTDQEEDIEEARETQTVVGRESDGSEPARARWDAPLSLSIVRTITIGVPQHSSSAGPRSRRLATIAAIQDRRTLAPRQDRSTPVSTFSQT